MSAAPSRLLSWVDSSYWMMHPPAYETMRAILTSWAGTPGAAPPLSRAEKDAAISAAQAAKPAPSYQAPSTIVVMSMFGIIAPRSGAVDDISQECCSLDMWAARYKQVMLDSNVAGVVINCDSPGGNVYQVPECAALIRSLRDLKPNVGVVTGMSASACYYLSAQFKELVCSPSAEVGSIGVLMRHNDISKMAEDTGLTVTYITSPRDGNKAEGNPFTPLAPDSAEFLNSRTDEYYNMFLSDLAEGRGIVGKSAKTMIDQEWGRGRMVGAAKALALGMVDRVGTLQSEIDKMAMSLSKAGGGKRMETEQQDIETANDIEPESDHEMVRARARLRLA